jgi:hypothetical protein
MQLGINLLCLSGFIDDSHLPPPGGLRALYPDFATLAAEGGGFVHDTREAAA